MSEFRELERRMMKMETLLCGIYDGLEIPKKHCPICNEDVRLFTPFGETLRANAKCPVCQALERNRFWWLYYSERGLFKEIEEHKSKVTILHFAPERELYTFFSSHANVDYWPVDYNEEYSGIRKKVDITDIGFEDKSFDYIMCNNVLEHIPDDRKAMHEMHRALKTDGTAYISVPMSGRDDTFENSEYNTPELRSKYFGQKDHVRIYGQDLVERLEKVGFLAIPIYVKHEFSDEDIKKYGLMESDVLWRCKKIL